MSSISLKNVIYKMCLEIIYLIYMYKKNLALNNIQWLVRRKTKPNQTKLSLTKIMELAQLDFFYFTLNKWIRDKRQKIFSLIAEHFGFIKYSLNKLD